MSTELSPLPALGFDAPAPFPSASPALSRQQKAAVIVRLLLADGGGLSLAKLPDNLQHDLTMQMGAMRTITHDTVATVVDEFIGELDSIGLSFSSGLEGALTLLDGAINPQMAEKLRKECGVVRGGDPWERIIGLDEARLLPVLQEESVEVAAVLLSKLNVSKAAELLGQLPGELARRITYAVSLTGAVTPSAVYKIGQSLASQLDSSPPRAFDDGPVERVGAILNSSPANTRDEVLAGLDEDDKAFAREVRKAIFTFANVPARIDPRDIPKITRGIDQAMLVTALAAAEAAKMGASSDFVLANMSKRMADGIRDEMQELGTVKEKDGEVAMGAFVAEIRALEAAGEIFFVAEEEE